MPRHSRCANCRQSIHHITNSLTEWVHDEEDLEEECLRGAVPNFMPTFRKMIDNRGRIHYAIDDNAFPLCGAEIVPGDKAHTTCIYCMGKVGVVS